MLVVNSPAVAWFVILLSGMLEVIFSISMKLSDGYSKPWPAAVSIVSAVLSVWLMGLTLKTLPLGTAYAVWAGIGVAGTALVGVVWFEEAASMGRLVCVGAVMAGIIGLQLQGNG